MKFTLDDFDTSLIGVSAATALGTGIHSMAAPGEFQDLYAPQESGRSNCLSRWMGHSSIAHGAVLGTVAMSDPNKKVKKNIMKVAGAIHLTMAVHGAICMQNDTGYKSVGIPLTAGNTAVGILHLWRGFSDDDKEEKEEQTKKK